MRQDSVFVSIIVPIFNMEEYLRRCLESIRHQTFQNFEVILVDDGSSDASRDICNEFLTDIRYLCRKEFCALRQCVPDTGTGYQ